MEHIIHRLLQDFEHGKMNRRQLVRSLAMAASVAGAGVPEVKGAGGTGFKAITVNHISYQVADYRKTRDFYADLLGMKVTQDDGKQCHLEFGTEGSHILPRNARAGSAPPKVDHIAYSIDHWDKNAVEAELKRRGLDPRPDKESFHVKDPDGFDLQISSPEMGKS
jgi:catechol 2,3-dioxygenase-like lactoylglutathione lyase family enzyme